MLMRTEKIDCTSLNTDAIVNAVVKVRAAAIIESLKLNQLVADRKAFKEVLHPDAQLLYFNDKLICTFYTPSSFGTELRVPYEIHLVGATG